MQLRLALRALALAIPLVAVTPAARAQNAGPETRFFNELRPRTAFLGVAIVDVDADRVSRLKLSEERGVEVTNVEEGSPADTAGIKAGDVLLAYNGETILGTQQFARLVRETPVGRKVRITVWRVGKEHATVVTTAAPRPLVAGRVMSGPFSNVDLSSLQTLGSPDVPTVIMIWNNSSLGLECEPVDAQLANYFGVKQGVLVRSVGKGSPSEKAGLKAGDVLTAAANHPLRTPDELRRIVHTDGPQIPLAVTRDHKELTVNVSTAQND